MFDTQMLKRMTISHKFLRVRGLKNRYNDELLQKYIGSSPFLSKIDSMWTFEQYAINDQITHIKKLLEEIIFPSQHELS